MNKMTEIAKLFDKELEEKFTIVDDNGVVVDACFNEAGLSCFLPSGEKALLMTSNILKNLLTGKYRIKKAPWKAKLNETYYMPNPLYISKYNGVVNNDSATDNEAYKSGFMCETEEQAISIAEAMIKLAREMQGFDEKEQEDE